MKQLLQLVQGSQEWLEHRRKHRNASEAAAVMGVSPWMSPYMLWELKTGRRVQMVTFPMQRGTFLEPAARAAYEAETGIVMQPAVVVDGEYSASLDGITMAGDLLLEIKVPVKARDSETWKAAEAGEVPEHYRWQLEHQLMVSGAELGHFYVYGEGAGVLVEVRASEGSPERLQHAWDAFMRYVEDDRPPPLGELDTVPRHDQAWRIAAERYRAAKVTVDQSTLQLEAAKAGLVELLDHSRVEGCGVAVTRFWKGKAAKPEYRITMREEEQ